MVLSLTVLIVAVVPQAVFVSGEKMKTLSVDASGQIQGASKAVVRTVERMPVAVSRRAVGTNKAVVRTVQADVVAHKTKSFKAVIQNVAKSRSRVSTSMFEGLLRMDSYTFHHGLNCSTGNGGHYIAVMPTKMSLKECQNSCVHDDACTCIGYEPASGSCSKQQYCHIEDCVHSSLVDTYQMHSTFKVPRGRRSNEGVNEQAGSLREEQVASLGSTPQASFQREGGRECTNATDIDTDQTFTADMSVIQCLTRCLQNASCTCVRYERYYQSECYLMANCGDVPTFCERSNRYDMYSLLTAAPTLSPTPSPTDSPTSKPTESPTLSPTASPTAFPTPSPTESPTPKPTESPTQSPTGSPTESPTTKEPTASPTPSPTLQLRVKIWIDHRYHNEGSFWNAFNNCWEHGDNHYVMGEMTYQLIGQTKVVQACVECKVDADCHDFNDFGINYYVWGTDATRRITMSYVGWEEDTGGRCTHDTGIWDNDDCHQADACEATITMEQNGSFTCGGSHHGMTVRWEFDRTA